MKCLSAAELREAHTRGDWKLLWEAAIPLVKYAVSRFANRGAARTLVDDLMQAGFLDAGRSVRAWEPEQSKFANWIISNTRLALKAFVRQNGRQGMTGSREVRQSPGSYQDNYADHAISEASRRAESLEALHRGLASLEPAQEALIRARYGIDCVAKSVAELTMELRTSKRTTERELAAVQNKLADSLKRDPS